MHYSIIEKIATQALQEIQTSRTFKQGKVGNWQRNEEMYYNRAVKPTESRSRLQLARMQEFVHTLLSKIDNPLVFRYTKRKNAQTSRVELLNAIRAMDQQDDFWDIKDIAGKKQAIIYGRAIYSYFSYEKDGEYCAELTPIDVYTFLIDPSANGINIESARYLGDYNVKLDKKMIRDGMKSGKYIKAACKELLEGSGNVDEMTQERTNTRIRTDLQETVGDKERGVTRDEYRFWRWCTTYEGERVYLLIDNSGRVLRCEYLRDCVPTSKKYKDGAWPYFSWAAFLDLTEFWTPSYCDFAREIFMAQDISINQMLDNAEAINKPQRAVNVSKVEDMASLKYRRDGIIKFKGDIDIRQVIQTLPVASIDTPLKVWEILEQIQQSSSGVTDQAKGVSDEEGKVGIYEGNEANMADRFGLLNKSYAFAYVRFGMLHEMGLRLNLNKKRAVELVGPEGVEVKKVNKRDIFKRDDEYGCLVEASDAQTLASAQSRASKDKYLTELAAARTPVNLKKVYEMKGEIAGFSPDQIAQLLDASVYGNTKLMAECDRDIESLLNGENIKPNYAANNAYRQRVLNYMKDHREDMDMEEFQRFAAYMDSLEDIVMQNEARALNREEIDMLKASTLTEATGMEPGLPPAPPVDNAPTPTAAY